MSENLREQILNNLQNKSIYEQLEIWRKNDRTEWSDSTFEILENILYKKLGEVPEQDKPIEEVGTKNNGLEQWEEKLLDEKDQPLMYEPLRVLDLRDKINWAANAMLVIFVFEALINNDIVVGLLSDGNMSSIGVGDIGRSFLVSVIRACVNILPVFFSLKAIPPILRILMEMEFNSRRR